MTLELSTHYVNRNYYSVITHQFSHECPLGNACDHGWSVDKSENQIQRFFVIFAAFDRDGTLLSISPTFCKHLFRTKVFYTIFLWLQSENFLAQRYWQKKLLIKCWWNWQLYSISSTFHAQIFCKCSFAKKLQSKNVTRYKLCKTLSYKKGGCKMLVKLKPGQRREYTLRRSITKT